MMYRKQLLIATLLILMEGSLFAQLNQITLSFTGKNFDGTYIQLHKVEIQNVTRGWTEAIYYPDTILKITPTGIEDHTTSASDIVNIRPNPFNGATHFDVHMPLNSDLSLQMTDLNGQLVVEYNATLSSGIHTFGTQLCMPGTYILHATCAHRTCTKKLVNLGNGGQNAIAYITTTDVSTNNLLSRCKGEIEHAFCTGDVMVYKGFALHDGLVYGSDSIMQQQYTDENFVMLFDTTGPQESLDEVFTVNGTSFTMKPVAGGTFKMGAQNTDPDGDNYDPDAYDDGRESPVHNVTLSSFLIGETEVTQALWQAVTGYTPMDNGVQWNTTSGLGDNYPAYSVSWNDIQDFLTQLNNLCAGQLGDRQFALPSEAQWEYAARGGNNHHTPYYLYPGSNTIDDVAWYHDNSENSSHPVKQKSANELGLYDMSGNIFEWCSDWYGDYNDSDQTNPTGPTTGTYRALRGGSWYHSAKSCRTTFRYRYYPDFLFNYIGFRLVLQ